MPVLAEAAGSSPTLAPLTVARASLGPASTASSSSPSPPGPPPTTSSRSSADWRRRSASATAARSTRSLPVCCRSSSATPRASSSTTSATGRRYRATVCFGASSTTDDLEGELTPADGAVTDREASKRPPGVTGADHAAAARLQRDQGRRPSRLRAGPRRRDGRPRRARGDDPRIDWSTGTTPDPDRPIAVVEVGCSAGRTCGRSPATSARRDGSAAYLGALTPHGVRAVQARGRRTPREIRAAAADGPAGLVPLLRPIDAGLDAFPKVDADRRPRSPRSPAASSCGRPAACPGRPSTTDCATPDGALVAIATRRRRPARTRQGLRRARRAAGGAASA